MTNWSSLTTSGSHWLITFHSTECNKQCAWAYSVVCGGFTEAGWGGLDTFCLNYYDKFSLLFVPYEIISLVVTFCTSNNSVSNHLSKFNASFLFYHFFFPFIFTVTFIPSYLSSISQAMSFQSLSVMKSATVQILPAWCLRFYVCH